MTNFKNKEKEEVTVKAKKVKKEKKQNKILYPDIVLYGYQEGASLSDLKIYLKNKAEEIGNSDHAFYNVVKVENGFVWEIHDSGSGKGTLKSVLEALEENPFVIVKTSRRLVRVTKNRHGTGISSFLLSEEDNLEVTESVTYTDKMKSLSSKGNGMLYFGIIVSLLGVLSLFGASFFKYGILDRYEDSKLVTVKSDLPNSKKEEIERILRRDDGTYIKELTYVKPSSKSAKGSYKIIKEKESINEEDKLVKEMENILDIEINNKNSSSKEK